MSAAAAFHSICRRVARLLAAVMLLAGAPIAAPAAAQTPAFNSKINAKKFFPASNFAAGLQRRLASRILGKSLLQDLEAAGYLTRLAREMAPEDEHFIVVADEDDVNAFAYIGGMIVIYRGLWGFVQEEDGFISVVTHEMAHVKLDHVQKAIENSERVSTIAAPFLIAGLLVDDPQTREAIIAGSTGLISSDVIGYSRELEHEADIYALEAMVRAERSGLAMARIFSRLGADGSEYLSTHPASDRRGAYLADRLHGVPQPPPRPQSLDFHLLREKFGRSQVIETKYQQTARATLSSDKTSALQKLLARYGLLLSATKTRDRALGEEMSAALMAAPAGGAAHPFIVRALAENLRQRKQNAQAAALLENALLQHPARAALLQELFLVYEQLAQHDKTLAQYNRLPPSLAAQPALAFAAGKAAALLKKRALSNYLLAFAQANNGDFERAKRQVAIAEKFKDGGAPLKAKLAALKKQLAHELKLLRERSALDKG